MQEIVKIEERLIGEEKIPVVSVRELHKKLESKTDFSTWIRRRFEEMQVVENRDFIRSPILGSEHRIEYYVTINLAEHIAMLEGNKKGKEIRQYFIDFEKKAKKSLLELKSKLERLQSCEESPYIRKSRELEKARKSCQSAETKLKAGLIQAVDYDPNNPRIGDYYAEMKNLLHRVATGLTAMELIFERVNHEEYHCGSENPTYNNKGKFLRKSCGTGNNFLTPREWQTETNFANLALVYFEGKFLFEKDYTMEEYMELLISAANFMTERGLERRIPSRVSPHLLKEVKTMMHAYVKEEVVEYNHSPELCMKGHKMYLETQKAQALLQG